MLYNIWTRSWNSVFLSFSFFLLLFFFSLSDVLLIGRAVVIKSSKKIRASHFYRGATESRSKARFYREFSEDVFTFATHLYRKQREREKKRYWRMHPRRKWLRVGVWRSNLESSKSFTKFPEFLYVTGFTYDTRSKYKPRRTNLTSIVNYVCTMHVLRRTSSSTGMFVLQSFNFSYIWIVQLEEFWAIVLLQFKEVFFYILLIKFYFYLILVQRIIYLYIFIIVIIIC